MSALVLYAMHDKLRNGMFCIPQESAKEANNQGYGIFFLAQNFKSAVRKKENLDSIRCLCIDIDAKGTTKAEIMRRIKESPLFPTRVVESKNGFHLYWDLDECWESNDKGMLSKNYSRFLRERLVPFYGADEQACNVNQALRMPGFFHLKEDPFLVSCVHESDKLFSIESLKEAFPILLQEKKRDYTAQNYVLRDRSHVDYIKGSVSIFRLADIAGLETFPTPNGCKARCTQGSHKNGDRRPSLMIYDNGSFYCFGCGVGGDIIDFYRTYIADIGFLATLERLKELR